MTGEGQIDITDNVGGRPGRFCPYRHKQSPSVANQPVFWFAFARKNQGAIVRVATDLYLGEDNGTSWTELPATPGGIIKGKVALSADVKAILWKSTANSQENCWITAKNKQIF